MAPAFLLDTGILVHLVRQDSTGVIIRESYAPFLAEPHPLISIVTEAEMRSLAYRWKWGKGRRDQMRFLLDYFERSPIDPEEILEAYAVIDAHSESVGRPMGKNDVWIAAAAHVTGARLLTTDTDFDHLHAAGFLVRDRIAAAVEE